MLNLHPLSPKDLSTLASMLNEPAIAERGNFPYPFTKTDAEALFSEVQAHKNRALWVIEQDNEYVGNINATVMQPKRNPLKPQKKGPKKGQAQKRTIQIGYWVSTAHQRQGYATAALTAFCAQEAAKGTQIIEACVQIDNIASIRLLERCGFAKKSVQKFYSRFHQAAIPVYLYHKEFTTDEE